MDARRCYEEDVREANRWIEEFAQSYAMGRPLHSRQMLEDIDRQMEEGNEYIYIDDLKGQKQENRMRAPPEWSPKPRETMLVYSSFESVVNNNPQWEETRPWERHPIWISLSPPQLRQEHSLADMHRIFVGWQDVWQKSEACHSLKQYLVDAQLDIAITKVVCFALGSPSYKVENGQEESLVERPHSQYAAALTMAKIFEEKFGRSIRCFTQDPIYNDSDKTFLRSIGFTPLDDPKGFLEVDAQTLVFSVSPNVPVKQIIADVQWPAAMVWNTVREGGEEKKKWKQFSDDDEVWMAPYSTDPDSPRVREMVEHYHSMAFPTDKDDKFGDLTIYLRKGIQ
ncbi:MAG: hypothetical protein Q9165_003397 [Trypethelium subeluteriae]